MGDTEACDVCGFEWDVVAGSEVAPRLAAATGEFVALLAVDRALVTTRPSPERWSALEYGAHVRDVLLNVRDRIFVGLAEDDPVTKPMYRDLRIPFYVDETPDAVARGLGVASSLLAQTMSGLSPQQLDRTLVYAYPTTASRSLRWVGAQALHEAEHHLADAHENVALIDRMSG